MNRIALAEKSHRDSITATGLHSMQYRTFTRKIARATDMDYTRIRATHKKCLEVCTGRIDNDSKSRVVWDLPTVSNDGYWVGYIQPDNTVVFTARP
jgi:ferredoxin-like protein FixX